MPKNKAAQSLAKLRAKSLTPARRKEIARKAAAGKRPELRNTMVTEKDFSLKAVSYEFKKDSNPEVLE